MANPTTPDARTVTRRQVFRVESAAAEFAADHDATVTATEYVGIEDTSTLYSVDYAVEVEPVIEIDVDPFALLAAIGAI